MTDTVDFPSIPEWFSGKNIFITGGTGFIGKILIEKMLRSCPDIGNIYMLIRPKKQKSGTERVQELVDIPLFDVLKRKDKNAIKKIVPIEGNITDPNLGISETDIELLKENVNVIFHVAASVRFDDPLSDAILINTRATRDVCNLGLQMKNLKVLVHISTTYCNADREIIDEVLYPPHADWREAIRIAEEMDAHTLDIFTAKYIEPLPNTYTFTKQLGEHVVNDLCVGKIPSVIVRPSIVISTLSDPIIGWMDNFNGPVALQVGIGKGIIRTSLVNPDITPDYMAVDIAAKAILAATWKKGYDSDRFGDKSLELYNASNNKVKNITNKELLDLGMNLCWEVPLNDTLWYPNLLMTSSPLIYYLQVVFLHVFPAIFVDTILKLIKKKPMLMKVQRRVYNANTALYTFIMNEWTFINNKFIVLDSKLHPNDKEDFACVEAGEQIEVYEFFRNAILGARQYLLKEDNSTLPQAKIHAKRMWIISTVANALSYVFFVWMFLKLNIAMLLLQTPYNLVLFAVVLSQLDYFESLFCTGIDTAYSFYRYFIRENRHHG